MQSASHNSEAPFVSHNSEAQGRNNEDFHFDKRLPNAHVLVVGDFAGSAYPGLDKLAKDALERLLSNDKISAAPPPEMLAAIAVMFNNRLLEYRAGYPDKKFQCCAVFAAISGTEFYYLPIGDCRVAVRRGDLLLLLNGTVWRDAADNPLSTVITADQKMSRGPEEHPSSVMGAHSLSFFRSNVNKLDLLPDDQALLYSDGVDKVISPAALLNILRDTRGNPPVSLAEEMVKKVLKEVRNNLGDDDRTILVALGPYINSATQTFEGGLRSVKDELATLKGQLPDAETLNALIENMPKGIKYACETANKTAGELKGVEAEVETFKRRLSDVEKTNARIRSAQTGARNATKTAGEAIPKSVRAPVNDREAQHDEGDRSHLSEHITEPADDRGPTTTSPTRPSPQEKMAPFQAGSYNVVNIPKTKWQSFKEAFRSWRLRLIKSKIGYGAVLLITAVVSALLGYSLFRLAQSSQNGITSTQSTPAKRYRLYYDTQQRRVWLTDTIDNEISPKHYRALFGQEHKLKGKMREQSLQFDSEQEAIEWLDNPQEGSRYVKKIDIKDIEQFEQSDQMVIQKDIVEGDYEATLKAFLNRVNSDRYQQVSTNIEQLKKLNPGVDKVKINSGDQLMVFSRKKIGRSQ